MHIITRSRLVAFGKQHPGAAAQLREWSRIVRRKRYAGHLHVKSDFPRADFIGSRKVVFNICGDAYRLIVGMRYDLGRVYVRGGAMATAARLHFTKPHVLRNRLEFKAAVAELDDLLDLDPRRGTDAYDRLEFLSVLVEAYEDDHIPLNEHGGTPQSAVLFMLEQRGMARSDLAPLMGGKARVSEFLAGKRRLSLEQVRSLRDGLGIPADLLIP